MFRLLGVGVVLAVAASSAGASEHYVEVWNPPEARGGMPHRVKTSHKPGNHRHYALRPAKAHVGAPAPRLMAKRRDLPDAQPPGNGPDMSGIPRQITPEGNVLRVDSRGVTAEVTR
ncbi:MAG TPA: hypothetical protein VFE79_05195 [Paraburkholderia sp.]|nr:hypothetical protein [Paraburkholderia sp.]